MSSILVTGANGQLGSELHALSGFYPQHDFTFANRNTLDLSNLCKLEDYFDDKTFDVIINCAAYTAVDKAEFETEITDVINHRAVAILARIAKKKNISFIHISSDYVFNGQNHYPYNESSFPSPINIYGLTKAKSEEALLEASPKNSIIIRTSWMYSHYGNNFVKTMLKLCSEHETLRVVFDQIGTPTYARDLAKAILDILPKIKNESPEIYHYSNEGVASWYDFSKAIFELANINCAVNPIVTDQYPTPAKRPHYSLLNKSKIKHDFQLSIPYWRDSLKECLVILGEIK